MTTSARRWQKIRAQVGNEEVILGLSGGVDSSVAAALIHRAIGDQLTCVFVDTGLLRLNEAQQVVETFGKHMGMKLITSTRASASWRSLTGVTDPEAKRKIIGREFVEVFQEEAAKLPDAKWLAQGTIYPDVIESAGAKTKKATTIKSHHNVGGLPETLHLKLLEPLRELFKDEVRDSASPLACRTTWCTGIRSRARAWACASLARSSASMPTCCAVPMRSSSRSCARCGLVRPDQPGVRCLLAGEERRRHGRRPHLRMGRCVASGADNGFHDGALGELPYELLGKVSNRIINEVRGINRVVYDISGKPPATIEWE